MFMDWESGQSHYQFPSFGGEPWPPREEGNTTLQPWFRLIETGETRSGSTADIFCFGLTKSVMFLSFQPLIGQ
jgi:hypothetical protein